MQYSSVDWVVWTVQFQGGMSTNGPLSVWLGWLVGPLRIPSTVTPVAIGTVVKLSLDP